MSRILNQLHSEWPRVRMFVGVGLRWWWAELSWLVAPLFRRFWHHAENVFLIANTDGKLSAPVSVQEDRLKPSENILSLPVNWQKRCAGRQTFISLDAEQVMRLPITLPRTALPSMKKAIKYKLITESPLPLDQLCFDVRIMPQNHARGKQHDVVTDVAICRRSTVEALNKMLEAAGVSASVIGFSSDAKLPLDFTFLTSRGAREVHASLRINRFLAISAFLICLSVFPATYFSARWLTAQTHSEIHAARESQDDLMPLYEQRAIIQSAHHELANYIAAPRLSNVLNDLANYLPRTTWLHVVRYENGTLKIVGYAPAPTVAARSLERSSLVTEVKLDTVIGTAEGQGSAPVQFELSALVQLRASP